MASPAPNANGHRRRQVVAQVYAEETHCGICGGPVDKTLTFTWGKHGARCPGPSCPGCSPHPMRPVVDEIVPRVKGGSPIDRSNCRLAHWRCNRARGDGTREAQAAPAGPLPTIAAW